MMNIEATDMKLGDEWVLSLKIELSKTVTGRISFSEPLYIHSTSVGFIRGTEVCFGSKNVSLVVSYPWDKPTLDVLLSTKDEHFTKTIHIDMKTQIQDHLLIPSNNNMTARLAVDDDIRVELVNPSMGWIAIGEESETVQASDFVMPVLSGQVLITIPIEIFWEKLDSYKGDLLAVFELYNKNLPLRNIFCKRRISNLQKISTLPRKQVRTMVFFSPTGEQVNLG